MGRFGHILAVLLGIALVMPVVSWAQVDAAETGVPQTAWGDPDLSGVWNYSTLTPLERPSALADKPELTEEEAAAFAESQLRRQNRDLIDSAEGGLNYAPESECGVVPYNEFWYDRGDHGHYVELADHRSSRWPSSAFDAQGKDGSGGSEGDGA